MSLLLLLLLLWQEQVTLIAAFAAACQCDNSNLASPARYWLRQKAPTPLPSFLKAAISSGHGKPRSAQLSQLLSLSANLLEILIELTHAIVPHYHVLSEKSLHI